MKIFVNKDIKHFFLAIMVVLVNFLVLTEVLIWVLYEKFSFWLLFLSLLTTFAILMVCFLYFRRQNKMLEDAVSQINSYLGGNANARIECDDEGELYRLFHSVNSLAAVLNAHAANEAREKQFLKNTISDISHQLKTPLAALNIYNGLLQDEAEKLPNIKEFATLSEQELDRIETLVQSLLKITKLDAGSIVIEKSMESVADMMQDVEQHFAYRARQEQKEILLSESEDISLLCDRDWLIEAIDNIVKNAKLIENLCGKNRSLTLVTKLLAGNIDIVKEVINKTEIKDIADSHVSNLKLYKELPVKKWLIREPGISEIESIIKYVDISFNSEFDTIKALNSEAKKQNKIHNIILTYELGDLREGCNKEELFKLVEKCMKLENVKIYGIGANLSCFGGIIPTDDNMKELKDVSLEVKSKFNID